MANETTHRTRQPSTPGQFAPDDAPTPADGDSRGAPIAEETCAALPPASTQRWTIRRKAEVVRAVLQETIDIEEVCAKYDLSIEEFDSWHRLVERHGVDGLRSTRLQDYRDASRKRR